MIKLIILDVDGVMTNGRKFYDKDGNIICKEFCDKDWTAIKRFKALDIPVVFLSGDSFNRKIAENRNIPFYHNTLPKIAYLDQICNQFKVAKSEILYVGDDLFDLEFAKAVGHRYCPRDAVPEMKEICIPIQANGGDNVIMHLFDQLSKMIMITSWNKTYMNKLYELDKQEYKGP